MNKVRLLSGIGGELRKHRKERHITQAQLAASAGLSVPTVRLLEQTRGNLASWQNVLTALNLHVVGRNLPAGETLGKSLALLRHRRGFNQRTFAELLEVSQPTIWAMERYGRGRLEILNRIMSRLGAGAYLASIGETKAFYTHAGNSSVSQTWETPESFLTRLYPIFGKFDLDPCSPRRTNPPVKARMHYTAEDDGLSLPWHGVVFVNPPYGRQLAAWIAKARDEVEIGNASTVIALIPARPDTSYWHKHIAKQAHIYFLRGRLSFDGKQSAPFPSAVVVWGADEPTIAKLDGAFADAWGLGKVPQ